MQLHQVKDRQICIFTTDNEMIVHKLIEESDKNKHEKNPYSK